MDSLITVNQLVKRFSVPGSRASVWAVNDVSFTLERGETLGLVGESGSGKTTVGRCLLRLVAPTSGEIYFLGHNIAKMRRRAFRFLRSKIQIVFQEPYDAVNPRMTIGDTLREPLRLGRQHTTREQMRRVRELAEEVYLEVDDLARYPHELSAGQLQRIGVARAMATKPEVIVLDEPTSLLDTSVRADIIALLMKLQQDTGVAFLFISHDLTAVQHISHRVAVMYLGKIVEAGPTDEIFRSPLHPYTRALLSAVLVADPDRKRAPYSLQGEIPSPINLPSGCFLHGRCPLAITACSRISPELVRAREGHSVACIRVAPLPEQIVEEGQLIERTVGAEKLS